MFPWQLLQRKFPWWEKGWTRASELPVRIMGACPFLFLEISMSGGRGKKGFYTSVR